MLNNYKILFATTNPNKVKEAALAFKKNKIKIITLDEINRGTMKEPVEDGKTFNENALIKAKYYSQETGLPVLSDDSGLVVDALNGKPGIHSARFSGFKGTRLEIDSANNSLLLSLLDGVPTSQRTARFVCSLVLIFPKEKILIQSEGCLEGIIADSLSGKEGFGYDPIFWIPNMSCTCAELATDEKNKLSHRANAIRALVKKIKFYKWPKGSPFYSHEPNAETT